MNRLFPLLLLLFSTHVFAAEPIRVLAASSMTDVLPKIADAWKMSHPRDTFQFSFDASSRLARQVESGVPSDLFFSADEEWMDYLLKKDLIATDTRQDLVGNELVVIFPASTKKVPKQPKELAHFPIRRFALAGENVPVSKYALESLKKLGLWDALSPKVVRGENARTSLKWVSSGEADAGVVYRTDALVDPGVKVAFELPSVTPIRYPAAALKNAKSGREFLVFCKSTEAQELFKNAGFSLIEVKP